MNLRILSATAVFWLAGQFHAYATDPTATVEKLKSKLLKVKDYTADATLKTDILFIKAPVSNVKVYYKLPNRIKIYNQKGLSILPKGGIAYNNATLLGIKDYDAIDGGQVMIGKTKTTRIRVLPREINTDIAVMDLYVDEANLLLLKATITSKEMGSFDIEMQYGKWANMGLPDKTTFVFNVKDYKMPKSITLDFDESTQPKKGTTPKNGRGRIELIYSNYTVNQGINDKIFEGK